MVRTPGNGSKSDMILLLIAILIIGYWFFTTTIGRGIINLFKFFI